MSRVFLFGLIKSYKNIITLTFRNGNQVAIIQTIANNGHKKFLNTKVLASNAGVISFKNESGTII